MKFAIRPLQEHAEFRQCEQAQRAIWGGVSVAAEVLIVTQKFGGLVLGAFAGKRLVGFICAFLARRQGQIIHWSHMMGLLPEFRDKGLGLRLKLAHRELARRQGIQSICWTYDPLQSRNASLNLVKLGARVEEYIADCYGDFPSVIEKGLPSDRFIVDWKIASRSIARRLAGGRLARISLSWPKVNLTGVNAQGFLTNRNIDLSRRDSRMLVEIPINTDEMRSKSVALARRWRMETRKIFLHYLSTGYRVDGFINTEGRARSRCYYALRRAGN